MNAKAKKILKVTGRVCLGVLLFALLAVVALPLWIGPVARGVANWQAPKITGCDFNLGRFALNQYNGKLTVGEMQLANPPECGEGNCVELNRFFVDVKPMSVLSKTIHIEEVTIDGLVVSTTLTAANFRKILVNVKGESKDGKPEEKAEQEPEGKGEGKRFIIDRFVLSNFKLNLGYMPIALPTITLEGIGVDEPEGATAGEVWASVYNKVMESIGAVGGAIGDLGKGAASLVGKGAKAAAGLVGDSASAVGDGAAAAAGAVGDGAAAAANAVGDGAAAAIDAVGDGAAAIGGAVMDGAGAVGGALKGIFKKEE